MALTDAKIRNAKPGGRPIKLTDGSGLYLEVRPTGSKLWRYRYRIAGKENVFAAGEYVQVPEGETRDRTLARRNAGMLTLAEARAKRHEWRALVKEGIHPAHDRQASRVQNFANNACTFEALAREWIAKKEHSLDALLSSSSPTVLRSQRVPQRWRRAYSQCDVGATA